MDDHSFRAFEQQVDYHRDGLAGGIINTVIAEVFSLMSGRTEPLTRDERDEITRRVIERHQDALEALDALRADLGPDAGMHAAQHMSRLLGNAVHRAIEWRYAKCPRCEIEVLRREPGKDWPSFAAVSRTARGENDAAIPICSRCGEREACAATAANPDNPKRHRSGEGVVSPTKWPVAVEQTAIGRPDRLHIRARVEARRAPD